MADYVRHHRGRNTAENAQLRRLPFDAVVEHAAMCKRLDGKRHSHQRRIPRRSLEAAHRRLRVLSLRRCRTFEELHERITAATEHIRRIGPLTAYDIATRIGAHLKLEPNLVFLNCGALVGARRLGYRGCRTLQVHKLPRAFRRLSAAEIEDCLCIYKAELGAIMRRRGRSRQG